MKGSAEIAAMPADDRLEALLDRWHDAQADGVALTPAELCKETPDLLPEFQRYLLVLNRFEALRSDEVVATLDRPSATTTTLPDPLPTHGSKPPAQPLTLPAIGDEFDGYRIVTELGRGGMGCVFRASNLLLGRDEALKVILPEVAVKPQARARFLREARAMAAVRHDHIVEVYHVREPGGVPYLAMPLLKGETLVDRLRRERVLPAAVVVRIGLQMAEGLAEAHARRLIHRDIKPGNVWLEAGTNRVKLLDFGLVREEGATPDLTGEGALLGTPLYMSPEQINGEALDARSDLFSMGSVLYECATGRRAFSGATLTAILSAVAQKDPPAAKTVNAAVPDHLSDLIRSLLHKKPEHRPASALELVRRLRLLETGGQTVGERTQTEEVLPLRRRRRWLWLSAAACLLVFCLLGGSALFKYWSADIPAVENRVSTTEIGPSKAILTPPISKLDVFHYERTRENKVRERGLMGEQSFAATLGDQVIVEVKLSRKAYAYLLAFNPNGTTQLCVPASPDEPPSLTERFHYPSNRSLRFGLTDGIGLMAFAVVASDQPLPSFREWSGQNRTLWHHSEGELGVVWRDDGDLLDTLTTAGAVKRDRGEVQEALGESGALTGLSDSLKRGKPEIAVASIGFVVLKP
jgi:serine/threonine protein kinase